MSGALARTLGLVSFRFPARTARRFFAFALAEHGSMIDLRLAARLTPSPARAAAYLRHAGDEERHARMFAAHAREWAGRADVSVPGAARADVEHLYETLGEVRFLAFVHRGEHRGRREFEHYRDHFARRGEPRTAALFEKILEDERRHETYTRALLVEVAGSDRAARAALLRVTAWEAWRTWLRAGRALGGVTYAIAMTLLYLLSAPLALAIRLRLPPARGFE